MTTKTKIAEAIVDRLRYPAWLESFGRYDEVERDAPKVLGERRVTGARAVWMARGGHIETSSLTEIGHQWDASVDAVGVHLYEESDLTAHELAAGTPWALREEARIAEKFGEPGAAAVDLAILWRLVGILRVASIGTEGDSFATALAIKDAGQEPVTVGWAGNRARAATARRVAFDDLVDRKHLGDLAGDLPEDERFVVAANSLIVRQWGPPVIKEWDEDGASYWHTLIKVSAALAVIPRPVVGRDGPDLPEAYASQPLDEVRPVDVPGTAV